MLGSRDKSTKKTITIILVLNLLFVSFLGCVKLGSNPAPTTTPTITPTKKSTTTPIPTPATTPISTISDELTTTFFPLPVGSTLNKGDFDISHLIMTPGTKISSFFAVLEKT